MRIIYLMLAFALTFSSCQSTDHSVNQPLNSALSKWAPLSGLLLRVSQNQTHYDNLLDGTDCYGIGFPTVVTLNGQSIEITEESDFALVETNLNASDDDDDLIHFSFPLTVQFPNFDQMTINSQSQLESIQCASDFSEIRCVDFIYPLVINTYNTDNQIANTIAIQNDSQLYNFIDDAAMEQVFTIVYPISAVTWSGEIVTIGNNDQLEDLIEDSIVDCGENSADLLDSVIEHGIWHISFCEGNFGNYENYNFNFNTSGTITVEKNNVLSYGTWDVYQDDHHQRLELDFTNPALHHLEGDWKVTEFDQTNFRLKKNGHGSGGNNYVYFTRN